MIFTFGFAAGTGGGCMLWLAAPAGDGSGGDSDGGAGAVEIGSAIGLRAAGSNLTSADGLAGTPVVAVSGTGP